MPDAPVIFYPNLYYCFTVLPGSDKTFYPSTFAPWFGWLSLVVFTGMSLVLIGVQLIPAIRNIISGWARPTALPRCGKMAAAPG